MVNAKLSNFLNLSVSEMYLYLNIEKSRYLRRLLDLNVRKIQIFGDSSTFSAFKYHNIYNYNNPVVNFSVQIEETLGKKVLNKVKGCGGR